MVANITFLSFLLFSMCQSIQVVVNTWLNCSFFTLLHKTVVCVSGQSSVNSLMSLPLVDNPTTPMSLDLGLPPSVFSIELG